MRKKLILGASVCLLIISSCKQSSDPVQSFTTLSGKWEETFFWQDYPAGCLSIGDEDGNCGFTRTSIIEFFERDFRLTVLPSRRKLVIENDSIFVTNADDTLYTGSYIVIDNQIIFDAENKVSLDTVDYQIEGGSLFLGIPSRLVSTGSDSMDFAVTGLSSFIWSNSISKQHGVFTIIE